MFLLLASLSTVVTVSMPALTHVFGTRDRCTNARVGSSFGTNEKCQTPTSHVHPPSVHRSWLTETISPLVCTIIQHLRATLLFPQCPVLSCEIASTARITHFLVNGDDSCQIDVLLSNAPEVKDTEVSWDYCCDGHACTNTFTNTESHGSSVGHEWKLPERLLLVVQSPSILVTMIHRILASSKRGTHSLSMW